jgi:hypothetical protein
MTQASRTTENSDALSYKRAVAITPSDSVEVAYNYHAFIIDSTGTAGTIKFQFDDDTTLSINAAIGVEYRYGAKFVMATGTTATGIKGLV